MKIALIKWPSEYVEVGRITPDITVHYRDVPDERALIERIADFLEELDTPTKSIDIEMRKGKTVEIEKA